MSEENAEVSSGNEETQEKPEIDVEKVMQELEKVKATNQRLLDESVQYKNKYKGLKEEIDSKQKQSLEEQENFKELYEIERKSRYEIEDKLHNYKKQALKKDMQFKVASKAQDAFDVADVINAMPKDMLMIDEESEQVQGVDDALGWVKENKPWLFKQSRGTGMSDSRPQASSGRKTWNDYSKEEKNAAFKDSLREWL